MRTDDQIIDDVSAWEAETSRLRHLRFKWLAWALYLVLVFSAMAVGITVLAPLVQERNDEARRIESERNARYEEAWAACTKALGAQVCNDVEARLAERCLAGATLECLKHEIGP